MNIVIPYEPRTIWRDTIHPALEAYRYAVLVCHRRFGKTVGTINHILKRALLNSLPSPRYAYIAPYRYQAKMIAWEYLKFYSSPIPARRVNESELYVELPSYHPGRSGARIYVIGSDHPDALRGSYWDGVILDEYAQIKPELFDEVIRPALSDRGGQAVFIGTPKGQNQFYEVYLRAVRSDDWYSCLYTVDDSGLIDDEELASMKASMTENAIRQELYCDFSASSDDVVIPIDLAVSSKDNFIDKKAVAGLPVVLGVDVARFGDDATVITPRQGLLAYEQITASGLDTMAVASMVIAQINKFNPNAVFIDAGAMGAGVIDRLRQLNYNNIIEVNFGASPSDSRYANLRAEMYFKTREWLLAGGRIPDDSTLRKELSSVTYSFNPAGRIVLEPKEKLKERIGKSPDKADSLVLTFAKPVKLPATQFDTDEPYNPLGGMI